MRLRVPAHREAELGQWLTEHGSLGQVVVSLDDQHSILEAYYESDAEPPGDGMTWLGEVEVLSASTLPAADWLQPFRAAAQPFAAGRRLWIDPREPDAEIVPAPDGRVTMRLPARTAFGTGTHESTRLVLELLDDAQLEGARVLDVGTGTGVLAFAALLAGAAAVVACDIDLPSPVAVVENSRLNGIAETSVFAGSLDALRAGARFDVALLNVIPSEAAPLLTGLAGMLRPDSRLFASGVLERESGPWLAMLAAAGFHETRRLGAGEWVAFELARVAGRG